MSRVPQFGSYEQILAFDYGWDDFFESCSDFLLVFINNGSVDMAIVVANAVEFVSVSVSK